MTEKKKTPKPEEDESTVRLPVFYKRRCEANGLLPLKGIRDKLDIAIEEGKLDKVDHPLCSFDFGRNSDLYK